MPACWASSTTCWINGRSTTGSISFGMALVAGRKRVPRPATGKMALRIGLLMRGFLRGGEVPGVDVGVNADMHIAGMRIAYKRMNFSWNCGDRAGTKLVALLYRRARDA